MKEKKLYNFRLPVDLIQQIDELAENRTEFLIKTLQQAIMLERNRSLQQDNILMPDFTVNQPYLQEYITHLKQEVTDWKTEVNRLSNQIDNRAETKEHLREINPKETQTKKIISTVKNTENPEDHHADIDRAIQLMEERKRDQSKKNM
ncbi:MAG: hypothetical protein NT038_00970 [Euryarchaeota archaeon]|nr:hypothetical protein [Euryarchaeota archaeon]